MNKGLGVTAKRTRIANYMDAFPEEFEVLEDNLGESEPTIRLQTKTREIRLSCDNKGKVIEEFQMRQGAGSKEEFIIKQKIYNALNAYYNDYYTGAKIIKNSFEQGELKLELADRTVTLTYDNETDSIEERDRAKRSLKKSTASVDDKPKKEVITTIEEKKPELISKPSPVREKTKSYDKWGDGVIVKNVCNNKKYKVKHDEGNIIEVFDSDHGYLIMARADLVIENEDK